MPKPDPTPELSPQIRAVLARLRTRIRAYVWVEGLSLAVLWLGLTFWAGLALDYLPVLAGASEMPHAARAVVLAIIGVVLAYILYHWVLRRSFVRMADRSMAVLIERQFEAFQDSLVTAVELTEKPDHAESFSPAMLAHTGQEAQQATAAVRLGDVFNFRPLIRSSVGAAIMLASVIVFYAVNAQALETWVNRFYLLKDEPWARYARIEIVGVELLGGETSGDALAEVPLIEFKNQSLKVAKGSNLRLRVRADLGAEKVPEFCTIIYRTEDGDRGRVDMNKSKRTGGEFQDYSFSAKPLEGILSSLRFDVVGFDYRIRDYRIEVVDSPAVVATELDCTYPPYMVDEKLSLWLPRTIDLTNATQLPVGTQVTIRAKANKPLKQVDLFNPETKERIKLDAAGGGIDGDQFTYSVPALKANLTLDATLHDIDDVVTEQPHRLFIAVVADEPPAIQVSLKGIGSAVTPDVIIPVTGKIIDDFAVSKSWFDAQRSRLLEGASAPEIEPREFSFDLGKGGAVEASVDFRELRSEPDGWQLAPGDKLLLTIKAADKFDLNGAEPNVGNGELYELDVVTPDALLAMLEAKELGLRRRFEQIIDEMSQMRDSLVRVKSDVVAAASEPGEAEPEPDPGAAPVDPAQAEAQKRERSQSLRLLRSQQSLQQTRKSAQELLGVAASFHAIREELINNRVDTEDRKKRLKELVADPLQQIGETMFPELDRRMVELEKLLLQDINAKKYDLQAGVTETESSIDQTNDILAELDKILQQMLDLETFNELLDIVRAIQNDQKQLIDRTETQRKQDLIKDLQ